MAEPQVKTCWRTSVSKLTLNVCFIISCINTHDWWFTTDDYSSHFRDLKWSKDILCVNIIDHYLLHFCEHRAFLAPFDKLGDIRICALDYCTNGPIPFIPYFSFEAKRECFIFCGSSVPNTLNFAGDAELKCFHGVEIKSRSNAGYHRDVSHRTKAGSCL